jgi:hypothetical protein
MRIIENGRQEGGRIWEQKNQMSIYVKLAWIWPMVGNCYCRIAVEKGEERGI